MQLPPKSSLGPPVVAPSAGTEKKSPVAEAKAASAQLILESQGQAEGSRLPLEKIPAHVLAANFLPKPKPEIGGIPLPPPEYFENPKPTVLEIPAKLPVLPSAVTIDIPVQVPVG